MFEESNLLYKTNDDRMIKIAEDYGIQLYNFSGLDIPFGSKWERIAVNLSGGADSACLTYLLCRIIEENKFDTKITIITHVRCWTTRPWQQPISVKVFNKLKEMFPSIISDRNENFIAPELEHGSTGYIYKHPVYGTDHSGDQLQVSSFNAYLGYRNKINAVFNATSSNPPGTDFPKKMKDREKKVEDGELRDLIIFSDEGFLCHPFKFVDKSWIIAQYYKYGIEDLFLLTRSCEGDVTHKNIKSVVPNYKEYHSDLNVPECRSCFWCLERNWALDKLDEVLEKIKDV